MWYCWARGWPHRVTTRSPDLTDWHVIPHVRRVEQHGGVAGKMRRLGDGRGGDERPVLEDGAVGLDGDGHVHGVGDGSGALELGQQRIGEKLILVCVGVGQWNAKASGRSLGLRFPQTLLLGPAVLEPYFNLCLGQFQVFSKFCSLCH